ncbi:phosphorelay sensor kinase [Aureococcus anophagefferens]|nr:phosphorelay sensor kinase [Aureococcus anophagefferens]
MRVEEGTPMERNYDFFDIDDEYMRLEEEGNISERAPFPAQDETRCPVFNPNANWRLGWDGYMLVLVTFVFFVTPFEIAFVNRGEYWDGLWTMNRLVDLSFFGDMVLTFNTGYYNWRENRCLMYRDRLPLPSQVAILRLIRLIRLVRLIRIAKAPRIIERWNRYMTLSFKMQVIIKYMFALVTLHLEACLIRLAHGVERGDRRNQDTNSYLRWWVIEWRGANFNDNWALYVDCLDWAAKTMLGESAYQTTGEGLLSVSCNVIGVAFVAFLFGDLTNILCNLDPASNEFKQTVDNLNKFMADKRFPAGRARPAARLGHKVVRVTFFSYARQCTLGIVVGRRLKIRAVDGGGDDGGERRDATIVGLLGDMRYDVRYDDGSVEHGVAHARISVQDEEVAIQKAVSAMEIATKLLVTQIAHAMEMAMFMAGDYIVRHSVSFCDTMYLVDAGKVMTFGREVTAPFALSVVEDGDSFGDKEIATLVAGHGARAAWFNARATRMSYCYVLGGRVFVKLINRPGFENFLKYISRYGTWYNFKLNVVKAMRSGELAAVAKLARPPAEAAAEEIRRGEAARVEAAVGAVVGKLADAVAARFDDLQRSVDARFAALEAKLDAAAARVPRAGDDDAAPSVYCSL